MVKNTPKNIKKNSKDVKVSVHSSLFKKLFSKNPILNVVTKTVTNGNKHQQKIKLQGKHYWVSCNCENFKFQWEYALSLYGGTSIIYGNGESAEKTNPSNSPGVCKHLYKIIKKKGLYKELKSLKEKRLLQNIIGTGDEE